MTKLLSALVAAVFAIVSLTPVAFAAADDKKEGTLAAQCKGKEPGDTVIVAGKELKCPPAKGEGKKD